MIFSTAGTERMRLLNTGNVGIGINAPTSLLHLNRTGATSVYN